MLAALIDEHRKAVAAFGEDTRDETLTRTAERIRATQFKVEAYAAYLAGAVTDHAWGDAGTQAALKASLARLPQLS